jgi:hypothetical protein
MFIVHDTSSIFQKEGQDNASKKLIPSRPGRRHLLFSLHNSAFFADVAAKNRAFRFNLLAAPKGFPLQSLAPHGLVALRAICFL